MKRFLKNIVKNNKIIYNIYYYFFSYLLKFIGLFLNVKDDTVLFVCYGGRKYDDSTKVLYEYMKKNKEYKKYKTIWAFVNPEKYEMIPKDEKIKIDTLNYYITAMKTKYWITNSSILRGLNFKKKETKYIVFAHGTLGIKKLDKDLGNKNKSFKLKKKTPIDMYICQGKQEKEKRMEIHGLEESKIFQLGLPRNDELANISEEKKKECRKKINIPEGKKVILYAPTFREYEKDKFLDSVLKPPFDFKEMEKQLSKEYVLVTTAHYEVAKLLDIPQNSSFVINEFKYPYINDLLIAADILISDYSSVVFDYSILERPILCFAHDYDLFMKERGTYIDLNSFFYDGVIKTQEQLINIIKNMDYNKESEHTKKIKEKYILKYGNTVSDIAKKIFKEN